VYILCYDSCMHTHNFYLCSWRCSLNSPCLLFRCGVRTSGPGLQGLEVVLAIWGDTAKEDDAQWQGGSVLWVKNCKVSGYNGVSLSTLSSSKLVLEPQVKEKQNSADLQPFGTRATRLFQRSPLPVGSLDYYCCALFKNYSIKRMRKRRHCMRGGRRWVRRRR
jgi:hypothetical protein